MMKWRWRWRRKEERWVPKKKRWLWKPKERKMKTKMIWREKTTGERTDEQHHLLSVSPG
ncbi:unnamed protein product [Gadus morhua 'NCC']